MTSTEDAVPETLTRRGLHRVLVVLCVTEVTSWGVLYYAFPVLAPAIGADTGWSASTITAAFSASQATAALVGVPVGRLLDRWGPRLVMSVGSALAGPALVTIATARSLAWFLTGWVLTGVAMAAVLYQPAFAALTRWWGPRRVTALTGLTMVAGLASTIFAPLTATLGTHLGWRHAYLVLAAGLAAITVPAHALGLAGRWPRAGTARGSDRSPDPGPVARSRPFVLLAVALSLGSFAVYAVVIDLVPLLIERGLSTGTAAWALGLGGLGQLCGRMGYPRLVAHTGVRTRTAAVLGATSTSIGLLAVLPGPAGALIAVAVLVGATRGVFTLLAATAISDRWGTAHYGRLNGVLSAPVLLATSIAPWAGTVLAELLGGYPAAFAVLAGCGALATILTAHTAPARHAG